MLVGCVLGILGGVFNSVWSVLGAFAGGRPNPFTSPATLLKELGSELDWIALKALEKDRERFAISGGGVVAVGKGVWI